MRALFLPGEDRVMLESEDRVMLKILVLDLQIEHLKKMKTFTSSGMI